MTKMIGQQAMRVKIIIVSPQNLQSRIQNWITLNRNCTIHKTNLTQISEYQVMYVILFEDTNE